MTGITRSRTLTFDPDVLEALGAMTVTPVGTQFAGKLPDLPRPLYEKVAKAIAALGGKWNRTAQAHLFLSDPHQELGLIIDTGQGIVRTKEEITIQ